MKFRCLLLIFIILATSIDLKALEDSGDFKPFCKNDIKKDTVQSATDNSTYSPNDKTSNAKIGNRPRVTAPVAVAAQQH